MRRSDGHRTREAILDAAEYLFSINGLNGVSIRRITQRSSTDLASVNYYFSTKEALFREVLVRRVRSMSVERHKRLAGFRETGDQLGDVRALLDHFVSPLMGDTTEACQQLANYRRLISLVANSKVWQDQVFREHYDPTAKAFIDRLCTILPGLPAPIACWGFNFFLGSLTNAMAETGRVDRLSDGACRSTDLFTMKSQLIAFAAYALVCMQVKESTA